MLPHRTAAVACLGCVLALTMASGVVAAPDPGTGTTAIASDGDRPSPTVALVRGKQSGVTHDAALVRIPIDPPLRVGISDLDHHWQFELGRWRSGISRSVGHVATAWHVSWQPRQSATLRPYVEAALGLAAFDHTQVGARRLGSHVHFTEQLGAGLQLGRQWRIGWRYAHYSNAGLRSPNDGVDMHSLMVQWRP